MKTILLIIFIYLALIIPPVYLKCKSKKGELKKFTKPKIKREVV